MSRIFAYARVSTVEQHPENQLGEIRAAGFQLQPRRIVSETVSGSVAASERPGFARLIDRLEEGDILVVTKLDRLGRDAMDVRKTIDQLDHLGIKVHCLALGGVDLTSPAGRMTMGVINAVAEFERNLLIERTQAGLIRAKAEGKMLGRPPRLTEDQKHAVIRKLQDGASISRLARDYGVSRLTISRARDKFKDHGSIEMTQPAEEKSATAGEGADADPA
ncbi:recombinase family protein [Jiella pacifica]|uniref:Recombinase family protein n=1 Tax=Jiella pacifica TaxID=2696469 RepID=A0A6N9TBJ2_9HYPH|nr:recombinase family protein [Jiella pacifica]NDW07942.1 recombinase family protein [Jiella pacifica]